MILAFLPRDFFWGGGAESEVVMVDLGWPSGWGWESGMGWAGESPREGVGPVAGSAGGVSEGVSAIGLRVSGDLILAAPMAAVSWTALSISFLRMSSSTLDWTVGLPGGEMGEELVGEEKVGGLVSGGLG